METLRVSSESAGAGGRRARNGALYGVIGAGVVTGVAECIDISGVVGVYADRAGESNERCEGTLLIVRDRVTAAGGAVVAS